MDYNSRRRRNNKQDGRALAVQRSTIPCKRPGDTQDAAWVAEEDQFVLQQAKKKAEIRIRGGRAKPIDWLTVILRAVDPTRNLLDDEVEESELDYMDPEGVLEDLNEMQLDELEKSIDVFIALEKYQNNLEFWKAIKIICKDRRERNTKLNSNVRGVNAVSTEIDQLLRSKGLEDLGLLETQIRKKLNSNEPIDVEYWEHLLSSLVVWKARARLQEISRTVINSQLTTLRNQQESEALIIQNKLEKILQVSTNGADRVSNNGYKSNAKKKSSTNIKADPVPLLKVRVQEKGLDVINEAAYLNIIKKERDKVLKLGYVPSKHKNLEKPLTSLPAREKDIYAADTSWFTKSGADDFSQATTALYEREVARGVNENEEIFAGEEEVTTTLKPQWANKYRPRKPRYFNRVQMGYEWNKYNQTHYDHDNPPPKVVQGYKFNIFYPDLIDKTRAPTYRIERENGRKKGQSFAPAGEEDTCLIRFMAGPPYEDIAFRIVDKEWDYSAKRERGFRSSFDKRRVSSNFIFNSKRYIIASKPYYSTTSAQTFATDVSTIFKEVADQQELYFK